MEYTPAMLVSRGNIVGDSLYCGESYAKTATDTGIYELNGKAFTPFVYDNKGRLIRANGNNYMYDIDGRPTTYNGKALGWDGSRLITFGEYSMEYDCKGYRTKKYKNGTLISSYVYDERGNIVRETKDGTEITYLYDATGPIGFSVGYTDTDNVKKQMPFYYVKDILGNICEIIDNNGVRVVKYTYDAWGNATASNTSTYAVLIGGVSYKATEINKLNRLRYRGYYYDSDLGMYYLINRYYDSTIGRFISPDDTQYLDFESLFGHNRYAYCGNNPIMYVDPEGHMPKWLSSTLKIIGGAAIVVGCVVGSIVTGGALSVVLAGATIGATAGGIGAGISTAVSGGDVHDFANAFLMGTATGAISGAVAASPLGVGAQIGINAALGAANYAGTQLLSGGNITLGGLVINAGIGALCGWIGQNGWMQDLPSILFAASGLKNALKHVFIVAGKEALLRMALPAFGLGGIGGGFYGWFNENFNSNGDFIGI